MNVAIVTDSTCDLPPALAEQMHIHVIPTILITDTQSYEDGPGIVRETFYNQLPDMKSIPTTAAPAVGVFEELYARLQRAGHDLILSLHISGKLSGVFNAAHAAAQAFGKQIMVLDSQQISMGLGFQALAAAEATRQGAPVSAILTAIESVRQRTHLVAMLDTLEYVRRSGRVSWGRAKIGSLLNIKPFLEVRNGEVIQRGNARTRSKGIERLGAMLRELGALERLAILHTNAADDAQRFLKLMELPKSIAPIVVNVTPVIGAHVGPKGLGFVAVTT